MPDFAERAQAMVAQMTLEEKAQLLRYDSPAIPRLGVPEYNWWNEALHGVARAGTATVFPQAIALAASFSEALVADVARAAALEGRAKYNMQRQQGDRDIYKGITFWSPNVNIFRDPRWGRGQETYGEDPYLTSRLGVAFVRALQGDGQYLLAAACAKHFAVHSGPEAVRHSFDARVSAKDLFETYLPAFKALVQEAGVEAVMGAYNRVNGEPCCGSKTLLVDILRGKWGFTGHVVSDCWAIRDFHTHHGVTDTAPESAALAIANGCDLNCGNTYLHLLSAHKQGLVSEEQITRAAQRLMATRLKLGMFDECPYDAIPYTVCDCQAHRDLALQAARRTMVLLKNDGLLPLHVRAVRSVAVIGPNADSRKCLDGNYCGVSARYVTFLDGIRQTFEGAGARVYYGQGCALIDDRVSALAGPDDRIAEAVALAQLCDVTIVCLGFDATWEGEQGDTGNQSAAGDKLDLELPAPQRRLLDALDATGRPLVSVVATGSPVRVEQGRAIIQAWYPGQAGGQALADILVGAVSPSGKLPVTFYRTASDLPPFEDYAMAGRTYRYFSGRALYPFGFGLSYARFAYADAVFEGDCVFVTVTNVGRCQAEEVVQVYVKKWDCPWDAANHSLCAFARIGLAPGESRRVAMPVAACAFTAVDDGGNEVDAGRRFTFYVGGSQPDGVSVALMGQAPLRVDVVR